MIMVIRKESIQAIPAFERQNWKQELRNILTELKIATKRNSIKLVSLIYCNSNSLLHLDDLSSSQ